MICTEDDAGLSPRSGYNMGASLLGVGHVGHGAMVRHAGPGAIMVGAMGPTSGQPK